jgi:hypothetical protein
MTINKLKMLVFGFLIFVLLFFYYVNRKSYITSKNWKYNEGYNIGDVLNFEKFELNNDTIMFESKAIAKLKFCYWKGILVENITTGELGRYDKKDIK